MDGGRIVEEGTAQTPFNSPQEERTKPLNKIL
jgi:ABC-type microcin C transport system duplicated ATPase subunit YejF